jgi:hypothetical protein
MVAETYDTVVTLQVETPATILDYSLTATDYQQGAETTLTIKFTTVHDIPSGGIIHIEREGHEFGIPY